MKKYGFLFVLTLLISGCSHQLLDLSHAKEEVRNYYESGQYDREMDEIIDKTIKKIEALNFGKNSAAVFDIDETALANYPHIKSLDFGDEGKLWSEWIFSAKAKAIPQVKKLYDYLVSRGVKIIFITGRDMKYYDASKKNLIDAGYRQIDTLICRSDEYLKMPAAKYKAAHRANLVKAGYDIILNIGDQKSDSEGGNSGIIVKVPNYLYVID